MFLCINEAITGEIFRLVGYAPPSISIINLIQTNLKNIDSFVYGHLLKEFLNY